MDQREAVRISVHLRAQLFLEEGVGDPEAAGAVAGSGGNGHTALVSSERASPQVVDGIVEDLSRNGLFLRTSQRVAVGVIAMVQLGLPEEEPARLRCEVVRTEQGARVGVAVRFCSGQMSRRVLANILMRVHAASQQRA